jgi:hypothetical protein
VILTQARRDAFLPLTEANVPQPALDRLAALGVTTLEELRDLWTYGNRQWLVDYLGDSPVRFVMQKPAAGMTRSAAATGPGETVNLLGAGPAPPLVKYPRGVLLAPAQRQRRAGSPAPLLATRRPSATAKPVSLVARFPAVRDQGNRGTCVAFASIAFLEYHHAGGSAETQPLSEQFVYWACKESDGVPNIEGTHVSTAHDVLKKLGACRAKTWPYRKHPVSGNEGQGPPRKGAEEEAKDHTWPRVTALNNAGDVAALRKKLDARRPIVVSVYTYPEWDYPSVASTGEILMSPPGTESDGAHAVCLVGYELDSRLSGGGAFIFRNSWGKAWPRKGRFDGGYGTLQFEYLRQNA